MTARQRRLRGRFYSKVNAMKEQRGNLWDFHAAGGWACITTNVIVKHDGRLVMGAGVAREARDRFPGLDARWGDSIKRTGPGVIFEYPARLIAFPTKNHWRDPSRLALIERSARELADMAWSRLSDVRADERIYLPRPGCGLGGLRWEDVRPVIAPILADNHP